LCYMRVFACVFACWLVGFWALGFGFVLFMFLFSSVLFFFFYYLFLCFCFIHGFLFYLLYFVPVPGQSWQQDVACTYHYIFKIVCLYSVLVWMLASAVHRMVVLIFSIIFF
jgi:hypothetical protein